MSWRKITCAESDELHKQFDLEVQSGFTDMDGEHGDPEIRRDWGDKATGVLVVRDIKYPPPIPIPPLAAVAPRPDTRPCEHYQFEEDPDEYCCGMKGDTCPHCPCFT